MTLIKDAAIRLANSEPGRSEADIVSDLKIILLSGKLNLKDSDLIEIRLESPTGGGRIDIEVGHLVIEVKRSLASASVLKYAIEQLENYLIERTARHGYRVPGIITDGREFRLYRRSSQGNMEELAKMVHTADPESLERLVAWLEDVMATGRQIKPTPNEVRGKLGVGSAGFAVELSDLRDLYNRTRNMPSVKLKQELWSRLLETAFGSSFTERSNVESLFLEHTYLVVMAKTIAHAVIGVAPTIVEPEALLAGSVFSDSDISGVVESDFFDWVIEAGGEQLVRSIARRVARFDFSDVQHDVLKILYESVISDKQRHDLGEYYTPDWLADLMVEELYVDPLGTKVLDPSCGSGTFLFFLIRAFLKECDSQGWENSIALEALTNKVFGIDIHPVAVIIARINYLLAIGRKRLKDERRTVSIPVYLSDAMRWGSAPDVLYGDNGFQVRVSPNEDERVYLTFPEKTWKDPVSFDRLVNEMARRSTDRKKGSPVPSIIGLPQSESLDANDQMVLSKTFKIMCELHDADRDHIWAYYLRNQMRSRWFGLEANKVDLLIGNPPWLSYRYLPSSLQKEFKERAQRLKIWVGKAVATSADLSALFVTTCIWDFLQMNGRFGFVMPLAVITRQSYAGFREGQHPTNGRSLAFRKGWDLEKVRPLFPVPACVVTGFESEGKAPLQTTSIVAGKLYERDITWEYARDAITFADVDKPNYGDGILSPYASKFRQGATIVPRALTFVELIDSPLGTATGVVKVRRARSNLEKQPWKNLTLPDTSVESGFIYPIHLGSTLLPYRMLKPYLAIIPWDANVRMHLEIPKPTMSTLKRDNLVVRLQQYPRLEKWLELVESLWENNRSSNRLSFWDQLNYRGKLSDQFPIPEWRVVYSKAGINLAAARVKDDSVIDHKLYWTACEYPDEALYLCAILNSNALLHRIQHLQSRGDYGARDFDKYVFQANFPLFDGSLKLHYDIANLGAQAEALAGSVELRSTGFQTLRRDIRDALTASGISDEIEDAVEALLGGST